MKVRTVRIDSLALDPTNVRKHNERNLRAIKSSLESFGQRRPLIVARGNTGEQIVIAGNGTLEAAKRLGWTEIQVTDVPADWDADKARAYAIADNRTAELAEWNDVALAEALLELDAVGYEPAVLGFDTREVSDQDAGGGEGAMLGEENLSYTITYQLVFDDEGQQEAWYTWLRWLKANYEGETHAERIIAHAREAQAGE